MHVGASIYVQTSPVSSEDIAAGIGPFAAGVLN